jgi:hypothetical protein
MPDVARRPATLCVLALLVATLLPASTVQAAGSAPPRAPILFGLHSHADHERVATERALGTRSALVGNFVGWDRGLPPASYFDRWVTSTGAVPIVATGPEGYAPLSRVINGGEDAQTAAWADAVREYRHPIMIRLMAEMNGSWEAWSTGVNGNKPGEYVQAWRHIVDIFRARDADNAIFVWNPNRSFNGATPMRSLYPGGAYVDWIGLDVYNFGAAKGRWLGFNRMMKPSVAEIRRAAGPSKPLMINEVGCTEDRRKPAWLKDMFASLARYRVKAVVYFDQLRKADWRLTNNAANRSATRQAMRRNAIAGAGDVPLRVIRRLVTTGR